MTMPWPYEERRGAFVNLTRSFWTNLRKAAERRRHMLFRIRAGEHPNSYGVAGIRDEWVYYMGCAKRIRKILNRDYSEFKGS